MFNNYDLLIRFCLILLLGMLVTGIFPMDIVDLDDMGLIDSSTEFISTIGDTPVLFAQEDGTVSLNSGIVLLNYHFN